MTVKGSAIVANPFPELDVVRDVLGELLADKRSRNTRRAYEWDLKDFFGFIANAEPTPSIVASFLQLTRFPAIALVLKYKSSLLDKGLKEATVNRRLAAIKALVNHARQLGLVDWSLNDIKSEKVKPYRDTTGIKPDAFKQILAVPEQTTPLSKASAIMPC